MRDLVGAHSFCCGLDVACHLIDVADVFEADGLGLELGELGRGDRVGGLLEYAQYTRPAEFNGEGVPPVLVSGDHAKVDAWRRKNAIERTCRWRPDLIGTARLTPEERTYAQEILDASYSQSEE